MIGRWLARLDAYGMDRAGANEGFTEDRCPVCYWPVSYHPIWGGIRAKWPHRRAAAVQMFLAWI